MSRYYRTLIKPYLLDVYTGAQAAYSLRKLRSNYTGNCIQVRRSSDNATQNIGFVTNLVDTAAISAFVGPTASGFVTRWYDQSGNGVDLIQNTAAKQAGIYAAGSFFYEGTDIVMDATSTNREFVRNTNTTVLTDWTIFNKSKMLNNYATYVGFAAATNGLLQHNVNGFDYYDGAAYRNIVGGGGFSTAYRKIGARRISSTQTVRGYINGIAPSAGYTPIAVPLTLSTGCRFYGDFAGDGWRGTLREVIVYPTALTDAQILAINNLM